VNSLPRTWVLAAMGVGAALCLWSQQLAVRATKDQIRVAAPSFHFLSGKPLDRIRNGNAVAFDFQLTALGDGKSSVLRRSFERFIISYDLWEEKYSVTRLRSTRSSASNLSMEAVESWCLDSVSLSSSGLPADRPIWLRLEIRAQEPKEQGPGLGDSSIGLTQLIEIFSRAATQQKENFWRLESGPIRLNDRSGD
jgi:hypothetical protein